MKAHQSMWKTYGSIYPYNYALQMGSHRDSLGKDDETAEPMEC